MKANLDPGFLRVAEREIENAEVDGWLLYDLEARNRVAAELVGLPDGLSRRWFVFLRPGQPPAAVAHRIELQHWEDWEGELHPYVGWAELEALLARLLDGSRAIVMEVSENDAIPFVDNVPAGVAGMISGMGVRIESSAGLLSRTYAQWGERGLALHQQASETLADIAHTAYARALEAVENARALTELKLAEWILERIEGRGLREGATIVGCGANTANPHYMPSGGADGRFERGAVLLIDLWGRVAGEPDAVFADQTWMGVLGSELPAGFDEAWQAVRAARDGAVEFIAAHEGDEGPTGAEVDRHARDILTRAGFGEMILHRTGHGIDRALHGYGPNLDCEETRDERALVPGVGFSVEPGVYVPGQFGIRSEINVFMRADGPLVTTPSVQARPWTASG